MGESCIPHSDRDVGDLQDPEDELEKTVGTSRVERTDDYHVNNSILVTSV